MKLTAVLTLGIVLIVQCIFSVTCQDSSSEENNSDDILKQFKACPNGYCVPSNLCVNGVFNKDGVNIIQERFGDYDDMTPVDPEQKNSSCEFLTTCCATGDWLRSGSSEPIAVPVPLPPSKCGINMPKGYVYHVNNSAMAQFGEFPWMAALLERTMLLGEEKMQYFCGGSLIHPQVVLTAAHCVHNKAPDRISVRLGEWDTVTENEPIKHQQFGVQKMIIHENYVDKKYQNDLALLIMEDAAELNVNVNTICLPSMHDIFDDHRCLVSGWGKEDFNAQGKYADVLKRVELPVVPRERCKKMFRATKLGQIFHLHRSFMCAGGEEGVDICKGDGGSPLACKQGDEFVQVGIVSWGLGCGDKDVPGAYAKVANFVDWIKNKLRDEKIDISER